MPHPYRTHSARGPGDSSRPLGMHKNCKKGRRVNYCWHWGEARAVDDPISHFRPSSGQGGKLAS